MDTQDREKYRQLRQQQRERQLHIIQPQYSSGRWM